MYLKLHLTPESKRNLVTRLGTDRFAIQVREKATNNLANHQALSLLAEHLNIPANKIRIVSGHQSPHKTVFIRE